MRYKISSMRSFHLNLNLFRLIAKISILLVFMAIIIRFASPKVSNEETKQTNVVDANPTQKSTPSSPTAKMIYPSQVLNLANWKITIPTITSGNAAEIKQPELATYNISPWFVVVSEGNAVRFRAAVNGSTTSGSEYPRSELREMVDNGKTNAAWFDNHKTTGQLPAMKFGQTDNIARKVLSHPSGITHEYNRMNFPPVRMNQLSEILIFG